MANYTKNLNLYKVDPIKDGNKTFDINTMINDNWDKIDSEHQQQKVKINQNTNKTDILTNDIGDKTALNTTNKDNLVNAVNEVNASMADIANYKSDSDTYQIPTIVGTQIRLQRQSNTKRLFLKLSSDLNGGDIKISLDGGSTSKNLKDIDGNNVTELSKGFVEVVEEASFFTYAPKGGGVKIIADVEPLVVSKGSNVLKGQLCKKLDTKNTLGLIVDKNIKNSTNNSNPVIANIDGKRLLVGASTHDNLILQVLDYKTGNKLGSETVVDTAEYRSYISRMWKINSTKFLLYIMKTYGDNAHNMVRVVNVNKNNTITIGSEVTFAYYQFADLQVDALSENKIVMVYQAATNSSNRKSAACIATINNVSISMHSKYILYESWGTDMLCRKISNNRIFIQYASGRIRVVKYNLNTNSISAVSKEYYNKFKRHCFLLAPNKILLCGDYEGYPEGHIYCNRVAEINEDNTITFSEDKEVDEMYALANITYLNKSENILSFYYTGKFTAVKRDAKGNYTKVASDLVFASNGTRAVNVKDDELCVFCLSIANKCYTFKKILRKTYNEIMPRGSSDSVTAIPMKNANSEQTVNAYKW